MSRAGIRCSSSIWFGEKKSVESAGLRFPAVAIKTFYQGRFHSMAICGWSQRREKKVAENILSIKDRDLTVARIVNKCDADIFIYVRTTFSAFEP